MSHAPDCLFCRIVAGDVRSHVVYQDETLLAILDNCPIRPGHTLIVPKTHIPYFDDAPPEVATAIVLLGQKLAVALKQLYNVERVSFVCTGGDFSHLHAHVVPMHEKADITSRRYIVDDNITFRDLPPMANEELAKTALDVAKAMKSVT